MTNCFVQRFSIITTQLFQSFDASLCTIINFSKHLEHIYRLTQLNESVSVMEVEILEYPFKILRPFGLDPRNVTWFTKFKSFMAMVSILIFLVTCIMEILYVEWNVTSIVPIIEAFMAAMEGLLRWVMFFKHNNILCEMMHESKSFWKIKRVDAADQTGASAAMKTVWKGMKIYVFAVFVTGFIALFIRPIFLGWGKVLPLAAWFPREQPYGYEVDLTALMIKSQKIQ